MKTHISENKITLPTPSGEAKIHSGVLTKFELPNLKISVKNERRNDIVANIANRFIEGDATPEQVEALVEISKLHFKYHPPLLEKFETNPGAAAEEARALQQFESSGYQYFPKKKQLLVRAGENSDSFLIVSFIDERRAKCDEIWGKDNVAEKFAFWLSTGRINQTRAFSPDVTPSQAELVEKAISELRLPYKRVGKVVRLISGYSAGHAQSKVFKMLENGLSEQEIRDLKKRIEERKADASREDRYSEAQEFRDFLFLEDTGELLLRDNLLVNLSSKTLALYEIKSSYDHEIGRYVVRRKWGKHTKLERADVGKLWNWQLNDILERVEKAIGQIPEPHRERLSTFYHTLLAHALKQGNPHF